MIELAVIGDVHLRWDAEDTRAFDRSAYDALLFVGDLAGYRRGALDVAREIGRLGRPAFVIPGNHDAKHLVHLAAETFGLRALARPFEPGLAARCAELERALAPAVLAGYSRHELALRGERLTVVAARPHTHGGPTLAFAPYLAARFGVRSLADSAARLCGLVDEAESDRLVFLGHNGPTGLGAARDDLWGCDFKPGAGDWGDPDLRVAIDHAHATGKRVLAVVAGHMHLRLKGGGPRRWHHRGDTLYVNAARVPRVGPRGRHHVRLRIAGDEAAAEEVLGR